MSVHVKHLNADSTFLLTFTTTSLQTSVYADGPPRGSFTVLTDPWLAESGAPQYHPKFAFAARKIPAHINHLSQIDPPDVVVISQANTDHCHEETLRQLPPDLPHTTILAHPDAAKKIWGWKYFKSTRIHALPTYSDRNHNTVIRFAIPASNSSSPAGEATITLIKQARDLAKLHNAIAITYKPPSERDPSSTPQNTLGINVHGLHPMRSQPNLSESHHQPISQLRSMLSTPALKQHHAAHQQPFPTLPLTPPETPPESEQDPHERPTSSGKQAATSTPPKRNFHLRNPSDAPSYRQRSRGTSNATSTTFTTVTRASSISEAPKFEPMISTKHAVRPQTSDGHAIVLPPSSPPPTVPLPPLPDSAPFSEPLHQTPFRASQPLSPLITPPSPMSAVVAAPAHQESPIRPAKTLSVLYAPHGINYASVKPYATTHLVQAAALPLTLVMHPFDRIDNPWWLGGNISSGVPDGVEIVRRLMGRTWLKTHDEEKHESGFGLRMMKKGRWTVEEVQNMLKKGDKGGRVKSACEIKELDCGEGLLLGIS